MPEHPYQPCFASVGNQSWAAGWYGYRILKKYSPVQICLISGGPATIYIQPSHEHTLNTIGTASINTLKPPSKKLWPQIHTLWLCMSQTHTTRNLSVDKDLKGYGDEFRCLFPTAVCLFCPSNSGRNVKHTNTAHSDSRDSKRLRSAPRGRAESTNKWSGWGQRVRWFQWVVHSRARSLSRHTWRLAASCSQGPARRSQHHREQNISLVSHSTRMLLTPPMLKSSSHTTSSAGLYQGSKSTRR